MRLQSSLGYVPPIEFETVHYRAMTVPQQPLTGETDRIPADARILAK